MRDQILHAAAELFGANGYAGTSVGEIADAVEISPAALYWHFEGKEALLVELLEDGINSYEQRIDAVLSAVSDPADQLRGLAAAHVESVLTDPKVARGTVFSAYSLMHAVSPTNYRRIHDRQRDQLERWRRVVDAGVQSGEFHVTDTKVTVFALTDICEAVGSWADPKGPLSPPEIAEEYGEFALRIAGYGLPDSAPGQQIVNPRQVAKADGPASGRTAPDEAASLRETVLHESAALFRAKGFAGTSVGEIARAARMSPASLYWHFSSKEHLLYELVTAAIDDYERSVDTELEGAKGGVQRLAAFARGHVLSVFDDPHVANMAVVHTFRSLARSLSPEHSTEIRARLLRQLQRCREIFRAGIKEGVFSVEHPSLAALAVLDMCDAAASWYDPSGRHPIEWVVDQYCEFALRISGYRLIEAGVSLERKPLAASSAAGGRA